MQEVGSNDREGDEAEEQKLLLNAKTLGQTATDTQQDGRKITALKAIHHYS
jgi:hypothetical protein